MIIYCNLFTYFFSLVNENTHRFIVKRAMNTEQLYRLPEVACGVYKIMKEFQDLICDSDEL